MAPAGHKGMNCREVHRSGLTVHEQLDNEDDDVMRLIASTIAEVTPSKPWKERIVLGCWAVR